MQLGSHFLHADALVGGRLGAAESNVDYRPQDLSFTVPVPDGHWRLHAEVQSLQQLWDNNLQHVVRDVDLCKLYNAHPILEHVVCWPPPDEYL